MVRWMHDFGGQCSVDSSSVLIAMLGVVLSRNLIRVDSRVAFVES